MSQTNTTLASHLTASSILSAKTRDLVSVEPQTTVAEALEKMVAKRVGAVLVMQDEQVVGIWTERDLMQNTLDPEFDPRSTPILRYMSQPLYFARADEQAYLLLDRFLGLRVRHLIVKDEMGRVLGLISQGDVVKAMLRYKAEKSNELRWQYYETWGWDKAKRLRPHPHRDGIL